MRGYLHWERWMYEFIEVARYHAHPTSNNSIKIYLLQLSVYDRSPVFLGDRKLNVGKFWETTQPLWAWAQSSQLQVQSVFVNISYPCIRIIIFQSPSMLITRSFGSSGLVGSKGRGVACDRKFWSLVTASFGRLWPQELLQCHFSWQAQYLVMLECHFLWQAHYLVMLECHFCWQAQHWLKFG